MTQDNLPHDSPSAPPPADPTAPQATPAGQPRKKRHWIRRILLGLLVLIALLLILVGVTPALLSTGAGRTFVLSRINQNLNGRVTIASWSIGWTGGIHAEDVKVFDDQQRQIMQIPRFSTQLSLLGAMRGQFHLGDTRIEGLDFDAVRDASGTLNFAKLMKSEPQSGHDEKVSGEKSNAEPAKEEKSKLPVIDGELQLIGCRGTFQDDTNPDPNTRTVEFRTITGDVKIAGVNDPIEDSLNIVAYGQGKELASFSSSGKLLIAKDNVVLTPGQMQITQKTTTKADLKGIQPMLASAGLPVQFTSGNLDATLNVSNGPDGITVSPVIKGDNIAYIKDGIAGNFGGLFVDGKVNLVSPPGASAKEAVTNINFSNLRAMLLGGAVVVNGSLDDLEKGRKFNNVTVDWTYNLAMLWDAYKPMLSKDQAESLKDIKVAGNKTEHFAIGGALPADKPFNEAIAALTVNGEFAIDSFDGKGATLRNLVIPISLANGKARIAYAGRPAGQEYAPPAELNNGKFSLAGLSIDLTGQTPTLDSPDKMPFLVNVELNPVFTSTFLADNPLFADAHKSSGQFSVEIARCHAFPCGDLATQNVPANQGLIELNLKIHQLQIGNVLVAKLSQQFNATKLPFLNKLSLDSLAGDIDDFNVLVQHGVSTQHLTLAFGGGKRPLKLAGTVILATEIMNMQLDLPMALFGIKAGQDAGIKLPLSGPVDDPQFDLPGALKKNLGNIKGLPGPLKGLLGGSDTKPTTNPADKKDNDPVNGLLNGLGKKKEGE